MPRGQERLRRAGPRHDERPTTAADKGRHGSQREFLRCYGYRFEGTNLITFGLFYFFNLIFLLSRNFVSFIVSCLLKIFSQLVIDVQK